jgi:hypothetical protein
MVMPPYSDLLWFEVFSGLYDPPTRFGEGLPRLLGRVRRALQALDRKRFRPLPDG